MKRESKNFIKRLVLSLFCIIFCILLSYFLFKNLGLTNITREELQEYIRERGAFAPLVFILATFLQVTIIPIPSTVTVLAGTFLFGTWKAFLYSYIGILVGSYFAYFLGKVLGRPYLNWLVGSKEEIDRWLRGLQGRENVVLFFAFLLPLFPDDLLCSIAGMIKSSLLAFSIMQFFTRATSIGATILFMSGEVIPFTTWGILIIASFFVLCIIGFALGMKYSKQINELLDKLSKKLK